MTPNRQFTKWNLRKLRKATIKGALFISLASVVVAHTGCSSSGNSNEIQHEIISKQEFTKGVITTLEEISQGDFAIADEKIVPTKEESRVIVKYLDGKIDTMTISQAQKIAKADLNKKSISEAKQNIGGAIWWGVIGYYIGRNLSTFPRPEVYKNRVTYQRINNTTNSEARSSRKTVSSTRPNTSSSSNMRKKTSSSSSTSNYGHSVNYNSRNNNSVSYGSSSSRNKPSRSSRGFFSGSSRSSGG